MNIYVFGNPDVPGDDRAIAIAKKLTGSITGISFIYIQPNQDLPFEGEKKVVIIDSVFGLKKVTNINALDSRSIISSPRGSVHDFDLGFQLKYLQKLGKLGEVTLIGLPMEGEIDQALIQSILRKLVAQDIQGS